MENKLSYYLAAKERFARGQLNFEGADIVLLLLSAAYTPLEKDHVKLSDVASYEIKTAGYDRQKVEGRKVEIRGGQVVFGARNVVVDLNEPAEIGYLVLFDNSAPEKPLVAFKSLMNGAEPYKANPGSLLIELQDGLATV